MPAADLRDVVIKSGMAHSSCVARSRPIQPCRQTLENQCGVSRVPQPSQRRIVKTSLTVWFFTGDLGAPRLGLRGESKLSGAGDGNRTHVLSLSRIASAVLHIFDVLRSRSATASAFFSWPSPEFTIGSRSCSLGGASRFPTSLSQPGCHPAPRPEEALQYRRQIQVRVQFWKMDTETRRADLNLLQLRGRGLFQTLSIAR